MIALNRKYGPWAIVTGASSGIGKEIALQAGIAGLCVVLVARSQEGLEKVAAEIRAQGGEAMVLALDLGQPDQVAEVLRRTEGLDIGLLVCSAGFGSSGPFVESALAEELAMVDLNNRCVLQMTWHFARRFEQRGGGGIILLSSIVAFQGVALAANYAATKAYVQTLGEGLYDELRGVGVDVLCVAPGPTRSGFAQRANMTMGATVAPETVARGALRSLGKKRTVRPGFLSWALELALMTLPRWGRIQVMGLVMAGMAARPR